MTVYSVVIERSVYALSKGVNELIGEGWEPLGGICFTGKAGMPNCQYCQAMISKKKKEGGRSVSTG